MHKQYFSGKRLHLSSEEKRSIGGYKGESLKLLTEKNILLGDTIVIKTHEGEFTGILMPRYESADKNHVVIKLKSGYNIGIELDKIQYITKTMQQLTQNGQSTLAAMHSSAVKTVKEVKRTQQREEEEKDKLLPKIALISIGGTIASKVDYRTGGVHAVLSASELYASVPEIAKYASIDPEVLLNEYSENLKPEHWTLIINKIAEKVKSGRYRGVIISHGTDTMHYTASALSFALQNLPIPVILVGAQRSSDRPSSDAALNLIGATLFAINSEFSGVFVVMHARSSDNVIACHIGTRVRKNHTSRRDAFESIDVTPIALIKDDIVEVQQQCEIKLKKRNNENDNRSSRDNDDDDDNNSSFVVKPDFDNRVILLKYHPGFDPDLISHAVLVGYKAIIIEGTGLGHINRDCFSQLQKAVESGIMVFMTSQCIWGRTRMTVYDTGRDLLNIGVIPLSDMISETATVKAMWVLANSKDIESAKKMMQENIANEICATTPFTD